MKLENQVVSLELAKKLKELGVPQRSLFVYVPEWAKDDTLVDFRIEHNDGGWDKTCIAAHTVAELGEMLPEYKHGYKVVRTYWGDQRGVGAEVSLPDKYYQDDENSRHATTHYADTEADARAKMLIYLIENNLIKV